MWHDIISFKKLGGYRLELVFDNGRRGTVDLSSYVGRGVVYSRFADMDYFDSVTLNRELGVLCWPDGVDIAPETIYEAAMVAEESEQYKP
ncbi:MULTISPECIES: DUF2442 domain-containing protein [Geobacteraceae]|uniref:DUF2442 domain-containing protein n=1 Tax=Geobacteraceae TaxID=213422 RepID=UPI0023F1AADD|nr:MULTISPECIES: DUF2442 domain-containing protein [Geobacteraceae]